MKKLPQKGFTLYELLITLLIIGVILTIGVPNLSEFTRNSRIAGTTNDLHGSFLVARGEAARAKENVTICASSDPMIADPACGGTFNDGWIVFIDLDDDGARATGAGAEPLLKVFPPVPDTLSVNTNSTSFSFAPNGLGAGVSAFIAMVCDARGNTTAAGGESAARRIVVTPIGRSTILRTPATITQSVTSSGTPCA